METSPCAGPKIGQKINWYRTHIDREVLADLNRRSDALGFVQTLGHLGIIVLTGAAACCTEWIHSGHAGSALPAWHGVCFFVEWFP